MIRVLLAWLLLDAEFEGFGPVSKVPTYRDILFRRDDGSEVLVTLWTNGRTTLAERDTRYATWGPPLEPVKEEK